MALNRRMARLRARHAQEINDLFREFVKRNPTVEAGVSQSQMSPTQAAEWRKFSAEKIAAQRSERDELAAELRSNLAHTS